MKILDQQSNAHVLLVITAIFLTACLGCADPNASGGTKKSPASNSNSNPTNSKSNPTIFKQSIDRAKELGPKINERATDPGEKARLGGDDPTLSPPDGKAGDGG